MIAVARIATDTLQRVLFMCEPHPSPGAYAIAHCEAVTVPGQEEHCPHTMQAPDRMVAFTDPAQDAKVD